MSNAEDHPLIAQARMNVPDLPEGRDAFYGQLTQEMVLYAPQTRVELLKQMDDHIANDTGSLRQKAQLVSARRAMGDAHEVLLFAKR